MSIGGAAHPLQLYRPGNVRELENCLERIATMSGGDMISETAVPSSSNRRLTQSLHFIDKE